MWFEANLATKIFSKFSKVIFDFPDKKSPYLLPKKPAENAETSKPVTPATERDQT